MLFGWIIGGILVLAGLATYLFAPRVGPNPIFGVRVGYSYASREVWDATNRFGGALLALVGAGIALLGVLLQWLGVASRQGVGILTAVLLLALFGATAWMFLYARRLARGAPLARQIAPVEFRWAYLAPAAHFRAARRAGGVLVSPPAGGSRRNAFQPRRATGRLAIAR
jgi:uncharacterized membrane protein